MHQRLNTTMNEMKRVNPLVLNITNYVTMEFIANGLLSIGASPIVSHSEQETEDLMQHANSVVINLGTLDEKFIKLCKQTCKIANQLNKPVILDPVGAGASRLRTEACLSLINDHRIAIIRGNASEIMTLSGSLSKTKGVESREETSNAITSAQALSKQYDTAIVISGKIDIVIDHDTISQHDRGSPVMPTITGTGCLLTAVVGAFHAIEKNRFAAAEIATVFYGICGEIAEKKSNGPGSFRTQFLDALHSIPSKNDYEKN